MADPKQHDKGEHKSGVMRAQRERQQLELSRLDYHLVTPRSKKSTAVLIRAYETWREGWSTVYSELDGASELHSDEFTRLDHVSVLFHDGVCVSFVGIRWLDLSLPWSIHDSYFKKWPKHVLDNLGTGILGIACNAIIPPEWRGGVVMAPSGATLPLKDLTVRLALRRFLESNARIFVAVPRNDRNMHRVTGDAGSRRMARIEMHGIESDIVGWTRSDVADLGPIVDDLWSRKASAA
jgi:hypothetical protein